MASLDFVPQDPGYAARVAASYARQPAMVTLGATLVEVTPGRAVIELPWKHSLTQQHGFLHGGVVGMVLDSACGYAAFSLMPADAAVLTIEYKVNMLAPAKGQRFRMEGHVIKPGRTITVAEGRAFAIDEAGERLVATMTCTLMAVHGRAGIQH